MKDLFEKLEEIKKFKNTDHDATIQFKVPVSVRDKLLKKLEKDGINYKDLFTATIDIYLKGQE